MLKELVKIKILPVVSIMAGSLLMASCSSGVSRFDMPLFGLSKTEDQTNSIPPILNSARLGRDTGSNAYSGGQAASRGLAGFERADNSDGGASSVNLNARSSYLPPQVAAPEVRAARYRVIDNSRPPSGNSQHARPEGANKMGQGGYRARNDATTYDRAPMKPIAEARRSFLPSEPTDYNYNANSRRPARNVVARRPVSKRTSAARKRQVARRVSRDGFVTVAAGDTLYSIGRRHNVSVMKLMELNSLSDSNLLVGQQITLPKGAGAPIVAHRTTSMKGRVIAAASSGTYTVRQGENFQAIARKLRVSSTKLADLNGITDPGSIRAGEVLILPTIRKSAMARKRVASLATSNIRGTARKRGVTDRSDIKDLKVRKVRTQAISLGSAKKKMTSVSKTSNKRRSARRKASTAKKKGIAKFRWPVRGRIIGKFGLRADGTSNDGINLAVPNGTTVKAAEEGVVAYAGSELKGYGNLVLIRHANNWVSAYAHNERLLVKRGDKIKRGQVVARAGTSGSVSQPQVHFELRKGSKPVDPLKYMTGS